MPSAALGILSNSPVLGAAFGQAADRGLTVDDNSGANTNAAGMNSVGNTTNSNGQVPIVVVGVRG